MNKNNICNNCGKQGHQFHQCKLPITSYGIVLFRSSIQGIQYLMIRRKDSFGYIDFIRGKYTQNNLEHLQSMFDEMTIDERNKIATNEFNVLWKMMWGLEDTTGLSSQYKTEEVISQKKFDILKQGLPIGPNGEIVNIYNLIENATTRWVETEWEFPKGRRNFQEKDLDCALREFEEETGLSKKNIKIIENVLPFEEIFLGSNHKSYKHKYFLGYYENSQEKEELDKYQQTEVSKIQWKTFDECIETIRPYHLEKKQLISNIHKVLNDYRIY
jgi:8-oxo-dGTP pyrophosphatase MutT (NUDIX family)